MSVNVNRWPPCVSWELWAFRAGLYNIHIYWALGPDVSIFSAARIYLYFQKGRPLCLVHIEFLIISTLLSNDLLDLILRSEIYEFENITILRISRYIYDLVLNELIDKEIS